MKIEIEKVSNGWVINASWYRWFEGGPFVVGEHETIKHTSIARSVPDCLAELSKIMEKA